MKKILIVFLAAVVLSSCSSANRYRFNQKVYDKGGKAYIVLGAGNNASHADIPVNNYFIFQNEKGEKVSFTIINGETLSFIVNPGTYKLIKYYLFGEVNYFGGIKHSITINFTNYVDSEFSVKEGDALYLGYVYTAIADNAKNTWKRFFNFSINPKDISYETQAQDRLSDTLKEQFDKESGKDIQKSLLNWNRK
ncbi:MAG: lipoprotein [Endomicrobium sp.]|jgi:hypothetical protein|nr:lipoprotein [Endomicrobium sp.]